MIYNELLFVAHVAVVLGALVLALRHGLASLTACIALQVVLANACVLKQINLFGFTVTATDVFIVGITLGLSLMQKYFGEAAAKKAITTNFFVGLLYVVLTMFHRWYLPAAVDTAHLHYAAIFDLMPRVVFASLAVGWCTEQINRILVRRFFTLMPTSLATLVASTLAQLWDTVAFSVFALYGVVAHLTDIMIVSFSIKLLVLIVAAPFVEVTCRFLKDPHV